MRSKHMHTPPLPEEIVLDVTGLSCPLPVLKTNKALQSLVPGQVLVIEATDSRAEQDIRELCRTKGHYYLSSAEIDGKWVIRIRKNSA